MVKPGGALLQSNEEREKFAFNLNLEPCAPYDEEVRVLKQRADAAVGRRCKLTLA